MNLRQQREHVVVWLSVRRYFESNIFSILVGFVDVADAFTRELGMAVQQRLQFSPSIIGPDEVQPLGYGLRRE